MVKVNNTFRSMIRLKLSEGQKKLFSRKSESYRTELESFVGKHLQVSGILFQVKKTTNSKELLLKDVVLPDGSLIDHIWIRMDDRSYKLLKPRIGRILTVEGFGQEYVSKGVLNNGIRATKVGSRA